MCWRKGTRNVLVVVSEASKAVTRLGCTACQVLENVFCSAKWRLGKDDPVLRESSTVAQLGSPDGYLP